LCFTIGTRMIECDVPLPDLGRLGQFDGNAGGSEGRRLSKGRRLHAWTEEI